VLADFQRRFRYMLVDEYQDTNVAQYLWLRLLAQGNRNICCVGDDDQSIYGWRGAEVDNILRFERDFPGAVVIRLERNYRSTGHILAAASGLIAHNEGRLGKTLFTETAISATRCASSPAGTLRKKPEPLATISSSGNVRAHSLNEMAILVRASFQMREFEDRFVTLGLPYRVIGGPRFYERMEIRDALAYLRATVNPADDLAFERVVNTPKRGLGASAVQCIHSHARAPRHPADHGRQRTGLTEELKAKPRKALATWSAASPAGRTPSKPCATPIWPR
jgi:DNA helicase-2/ATP-dependent DNA helicase PcrA